MEKLKNELISTDGFITIGLVVSLIITIVLQNNDLATNIASGLIGFLGKSMVTKRL